MRWSGAAAAAVAAGAVLAAPAPAASRCDPFGGGHCLLPFPNDYFTRVDRSAPTGRRLALPSQGLPRNVAGKRLAAADYNRSDGFSPGQPIVLHVKGLDTPEALRRTGAAPVSDIGRSLDRRQPIVLVDATTRERELIWSELDSTAPSPQETALIIRPGKNLDEGHRYIVALRGLKDARGKTLRAPKAFRIFRDRLGSRSAAVRNRRARMERILRTLRRAGIRRRGLYLAWDFTVASRTGLSQRLLRMRDEAFAALGDRNLADLKVEGAAPRFTLSTVTEFSPAENPNTARRITGTFEVPCYLDQPACPPGSRFILSAGGLPRRSPGNTYAANFICDIPRSAFAPGASRARPVLFGHGLLGSASELTTGAYEVGRNQKNLVFCGTDWIGMSQGDLANIAAVLQDLSRFPSLADRLQQGLLDFMLLGRLMVNPQGFAANAAFQRADGAPVLDTSRLYFNGNSQGGILGGGLTAVAPDFNRALLGVPAMNFSTLLQRSTQFDAFSGVLARSYPSALTRQLLLSMTQLLWDRGEANGYAQHMTTSPYPNTPAHRVVLLMAFGDHQVANVATQVEARTIGAQLRRPALDPGRSTDRVPFFGIKPISGFPSPRSALVVTDTGPLRTAGGAELGTPPPPASNTPPRAGRAPHSSPGDEPYVYTLADAFFRPDGRVVNPCGAKPCYADGWAGP